jgi:hypothetical protein
LQVRRLLKHGTSLADAIRTLQQPSNVVIPPSSSASSFILSRLLRGIIGDCLSAGKRNKITILFGAIPDVTLDVDLPAALNAAVVEDASVELVFASGESWDDHLAELALLVADCAPHVVLLRVSLQVL